MTVRHLIVMIGLSACGAAAALPADSAPRSSADAALASDATADALTPSDATADARAADDAMPEGWQLEPTPQAAFPYDLRGVWGTGADDVYAVGGDTLLHSTGDGTWTAQPAPYVSELLYAVWGTGGTIYAVGEDGEADTWCLFTSMGDGTWAKAQDDPGGQCLNRAIWGTDAGNIYVAEENNGVIDHWTGGAWTTQFLPVYVSSMNGLWGSSATDLYEVGAGGTVFHSTGTGTWSAQSSATSADLDGVWGSSAGDVYAVGAAGAIVHSTGSGVWEPQKQSQATGELAAVWGSGGDDVYVVGAAGAILHSTGDGNWTAELAPTTEDLYAVWGAGGEVYAVGKDGTILHRR